LTLKTEPRIGILGGIFDPVHFGHLAIAQLAYEHFKLKKVFFIPAGIPPHKSESVTESATHRLTMLNLAIKSNNAFCLWNEEIKQEGFSFTVDTLHTFKNLYPDSDFYFIIGSDNLFEILTWRNYKTIIKMVTLCVAHRPGYSMRIPQELSRAEVIAFPSPEWGISSTKIRTYIAENISCRYLMPRSVVDYIRKNKLYKKE
jgi:nicotinate-nucleotide adenylyltransferase